MHTVLAIHCINHDLASLGSYMSLFRSFVQWNGMVKEGRMELAIVICLCQLFSVCMTIKISSLLAAVQVRDLLSIESVQDWNHALLHYYSL